MNHQRTRSSAPSTHRPLVRLLLVCLMCAVAAVSACASTPLHSSSAPSPDAAPVFQAAPPLAPAPLSSPAQAPALCWLPLMQRLRADGLDGPDLQLYFIRLGPAHSQAPMGSKITELFKREFMKPPPPPPPPPGEKPKAAKPRVYPNIVTPANVERCKNFLTLNTVAFTTAAQLYGVPKEIAVALLFVETRLGTFLGKENAFMTLASMAASTTPEHIPTALSALPVTPERLDWVKQRLRQRSDWAYNELKALIIHARDNKLDLLAIPGSIYGAVGLCQFMPSNFKRYAADGNGDGKIDLFEPADAIMSVGNYLHAHGWKKTLDRNGRHAVLLRYNKSNVYANTILALADAVNPPPAEKKAPAKAKATPQAKPPAKTAPAKAVLAKQNAAPANTRRTAAP